LIGSVNEAIHGSTPKTINCYTLQMSPSPSA
jgi:hypothetical protein